MREHDALRGGRRGGIAGDSGEDGGRDGEVEDAVGLLPLALQLLQPCVERLEVRLLVVLPLRKFVSIPSAHAFSTCESACYPAPVAGC